MGPDGHIWTSRLNRLSTQLIFWHGLGSGQLFAGDSWEDLWGEGLRGQAGGEQTHSFGVVDGRRSLPGGLSAGRRCRVFHLPALWEGK